MSLMLSYIGPTSERRHSGQLVSRPFSLNNITCLRISWLLLAPTNVSICSEASGSRDCTWILSTQRKKGIVISTDNFQIVSDVVSERVMVVSSEDDVDRLLSLALDHLTILEGPCSGEYAGYSMMNTIIYHQIQYKTDL